MNFFGKLKALFNKKKVPSAPNFWKVHRFLASDIDLAPYVRDLNQSYLDDERLFEIWQEILPAMRAPFLPYVAPKKPEDAEDLVERLMDLTTMNRREAEEVVEIAELIGEKEKLKRRLGVE